MSDDGGRNDGTGGRVIVVGSINQDLTTYAPSLPSPGQTVLGSDFVTAPGGKGANQAAAASSIGVVAPGGVHMVARVGDDDMGRSLLSGLQGRGVRVDDGGSAAGSHTGAASIVVDTASGQNTIVVAPGANLALTPRDVETSLVDILGEGASERDGVLVQLEIPPESALQALRTGSELGALTILNPAPAPEGWELTKEWYSNADIVIPNETELASLCGGDGGDEGGEEGMARELLGRGVRRAVIVTLGARGSMVVRRRPAGGHETIMISEPPDIPCASQPVVDTVGAGDAFCGALTAYLSRGVELERAASMACGVASMSVRRRGAQESYPIAKELPGCLRLEEGNPPDGDSQGGTRTRGTITFVTGNKNKLAEARRLLSPGAGRAIPFDVDNHKLDLPELQGGPQEIAQEKCRAASGQLGRAVLTEDTCLCFDALNGLPGPYIKWFLEGLGHDGLNRLLAGHDDKGAYAMTIVAFCPGPGSEVRLFEGRTRGRIVPARGSKDFGWDPIFEPTEEEQGEGVRKTYAEMTKGEKDAISHRGRAFRAFRDYLAREANAILKEM